jgi:hypothetical protein
LHLAARHSSAPAVIAALLEGGADPKAKDGKGVTPLHLAARHSSAPAVIAALLEGGADPKAKVAGKTAFDLARNNAKVRGSDAYRQLREAQEQPKSVPDKPTRKALGFQETAKSETRDPGGTKDGVALPDACGVGQELDPGQGCRIPGGGEFKVESDGCVKEVPDVLGPTSMSEVSMSGGINFKTGENTMSICIRGHVGKGKFNAGYDAEKSVWRIESLPEAN